MKLNRLSTVLATIAALTLNSGNVCNANPSGATVVHGSASFSSPNANTLNITNTPGTIINWQQFGIGANEVTRFIQQSSRSAILNRITGQNPSNILGTLTSNGRVFLVNPNGVIFGKNSVIDTAGLITSTLNISNNDFLNGKMHFEDLANNAAILNQGFIHTANDGEVVLIAPNVTNEGVIDVENGNLLLAAGQSVTVSSLNFDNIEFTVQAPENKVVNIGSLLSDGGSIGVFAGSIENKGTVSANAIRVSKGGVIQFVAQKEVSLTAESIVTANGVEGGSITIQSEEGIVKAIGTIEANGKKTAATPSTSGSFGSLSNIINAVLIDNSSSVGGDISFLGKGVALGGKISADGFSLGGNISINANSLSLADYIGAVSLNGKGGSIDIRSVTTLETSTSFINVSGTSGGSITHITDEQITSSGIYLAIGAERNGGTIDISAPALKFLSTRIIATGYYNGGRIRLGGEYQGGKNLAVDELPNAETLAMTSGTFVNANGLLFNGGEVIVWANQKAEVHGTVTTLPGIAPTAKGGFIEVSSGGDLNVVKANLNAGLGGTLLLDPKNITIAAAGTSQYGLILGYNYADIPGFSSTNIQSGLINDGDNFGKSVSLSGNNLAVGATGDDGFDGSGNNNGAVYLFSFSDSTFNNPKLEAILGEGYTGGKNLDLSAQLDEDDEFGISVSLDALNARIAVGAWFDDGFGDTAIDTGAAYLITFADSSFNSPSLFGTIGEGYAGVNDTNLSTQLDDFDQFGRSVSTDQLRIVVGADFDDGFGNTDTNTGAVYLFDNTLSLVGILGEGYTSTPLDMSAILDTNDEFGAAVSLDNLGLAIGAPRDDGGIDVGDTGNNAGAVYLLNFTDLAFSTPSIEGTIGEDYVGAKDLNISALTTGPDNYGWSVSLDGTLLATGANGDDGFADSINESGSVLLVSFTDTTFTAPVQEAVIGAGYTGGKNVDVSALLNINDHFGEAVSLDGNRLVVGYYGDDGANGAVTSNTGVVRLFSFTGLFTSITLEGSLGSGYGNGKSFNLGTQLDALDNFGIGVSLDGTQLVVSASGDDGFADSASNTGALYLFSFSDTQYNNPVLEGIIGSGYTGGKNIDLSSTLDDGDNFGFSVSLNGTSLAAGAYKDDGFGLSGSSEFGAVHLFTFDDLTFTNGSLKGTIGSGYVGANDLDVNTNLDANDFFGWDLSLDGTMLVVAADEDDGSGLSGSNNFGAVYLFTFSSADFTGGATLRGIIGDNYLGANDLNMDNTAVPLGTSDFFGAGVSLDNNRLAVGVTGDDGAINDQTRPGAVHLFQFTDSTFGNTATSYVGTIGRGYSGANDLDIGNVLDTDDFFGLGVSLQGRQLAVTSWQDDGFGLAGANDFGATLLFTFSTVNLTGAAHVGTIGSGYVGTNDIDISTELDTIDKMFDVSIDGTRLAIGLNGDDGYQNTSVDLTGATYLFSFSDTTFNGGKLDGIIGEGYNNGKNVDLGAQLEIDDNDQFATSISLDGNRLALGVVGDDGADNMGAGLGAVYLFSYADTNFNNPVLEGIIGELYNGGKNLNMGFLLDASDGFGVSVSLDGNRLAVGANGDDGQGNLGSGNGAVYLFSFADALFTSPVLEATIGELYTGGKNLDVGATFDAGDFFGISVSLDGNRLAVGAERDDGFANDQSDAGAVYLFSFADSVFTTPVFEGIIGRDYTAAGGKNYTVPETLFAGDQFGHSVSLDGTRLAVGADGENGQGNTINDGGAVFLFTFADMAFTTPTLQSVIGEGFSFGTSLNIAADLDDFDNFGASVSLDGTNLAVGARFDDGAGNVGNGVGAVYLFSFTDTIFAGPVLEGRIGAGYTGGKNLDVSAQTETGDFFGSSVSLEGTRLIIGASQDDGAGNTRSATGAIYQISFADTSFNTPTLEGIIGAGYGNATNLDIGIQLDGAKLDSGDSFGRSVSLDGTRLAVGSLRDDGFNNDANDVGAVYLFSFADTSFNSPVLESILGYGYVGGNNLDLGITGLNILDAGDGFGQVSLDGTQLAVGAHSDDGLNNTGLGAEGAVRLFSFSDMNFSNPTLQGTLGFGYSGPKDIDLSQLDANDIFGISVSLDGNRLAVGANSDDGLGLLGNNNFGAVYLFTFADNVFTSPVLEATLGSAYVGGKNLDLGTGGLNIFDTGDNFGAAVALDGNRLAVGSTAADGAANAVSNSGAVYLFSFADSVFSTPVLEATVGAGYGGAKDLSLSNVQLNDRFGESVSLLGTQLAVGAANDDGFGDSSSGSGTVYLISFADTSFNTPVLDGNIGVGYTGGKSIDLTGQLSSDLFGYGVSLDGNNLAVGSFFDEGMNDLSFNSGAVYLFNLSGTGPDDGLLPNINFATSSGNDATLSPSAIAGFLGTGQNVILQASNDITLQDNLFVSAGGFGSDLTLQAGRSILINANITTDNGKLIFIANDDLGNGVVDADRAAGAAVITQAGGTTIDTGSGNFEIVMRAGFGKTNSTSGDITLGDIVTNDMIIVQNGQTAGSDILGLAGTSVTAKSIIIDHDGFNSSGGGGTVGTSAQPLQFIVDNVGAHINDTTTSPNGIYIDASPNLTTTVQVGNTCYGSGGAGCIDIAGQNNVGGLLIRGMQTINGGDIALSVLGGNLDVADLVSTQAINSSIFLITQVSGNITVNNAITTGDGLLDITSAGDLTVNSSAPVTGNGGFMSLTASGAGGITISDNITNSGGSLFLNTSATGASIAINGTAVLSANGDLDISTDDNGSVIMATGTQLTSTSGGGSEILISAGTNIVLADILASGQTVTLDNTNFAGTGNITTLAGRSITADTLDAFSSGSVVLDTQVFTLGASSTDADLIVNNTSGSLFTNNLVVTGSSSANLIVTNTGNMNIAGSGPQLFDGNIFLESTGGSLLLDASIAMFGGNQIDVLAANGVTIQNSITASGALLTIDGDTDTNGGSVLITNTTGAPTMLQPGGSINIRGDDVTIAGGNSGPNQNILVESTSGDIDIDAFTGDIIILGGTTDNNGVVIRGADSGNADVSLNTVLTGGTGNVSLLAGFGSNSSVSIESTDGDATGITIDAVNITIDNASAGTDSDAFIDADNGTSNAILNFSGACNGCLAITDPAGTAGSQIGIWASNFGAAGTAFFTNGNLNGLWDDIGNWDIAALPGSSDDTTISFGGTVTLATGAHTIASLSGSDNLTISGGSLTVLGNTNLTGNYTQSGGTYISNGTFTSSSSVSLSGSSSATFNNTASFNTLSISNATAVLNGLNNTMNTLTMTSNALLQGTGNSTTAGLFTWTESTLSHNLTVNGDMVVPFITGNAVINGGIVTLANTAATRTLSNPLDIIGTGRLNNLGALGLDESSSIRSSDGTGIFDNQQTGSLTYNSTSATFNMGVSTGLEFITSGDIDAQGGTFNVTATDPMQWNEGRWMASGGSFTINTTLILDTIGTRYLDGTTLSTSSPVNIIGNGDLDIVNGGLFRAQSSATITHSSNLDINNNTGAGTFELQPGSSFIKTAGSTNIKADLINNSSIDVQGGNLVILDGSNPTDAGTYQVGNGGILEFATNRTLGNTLTIAAGGTTTFSALQTNIFNVDLLNSGNIIIQSTAANDAELRINGGLYTNNATMIMDNTLGNTVFLNVTSGTFVNSGTGIVQSIGSGTPNQLVSTIGQNMGTFNIDHDLDLVNGDNFAQNFIHSAGIFDIAAGVNLNMTGPVAPYTFVWDGGTIQGTSTSAITSPISINTTPGAVLTKSGAMTLRADDAVITGAGTIFNMNNGVFDVFGVLSIDTGGTFNHNGGTVNMNTGGGFAANQIYLDAGTYNWNAGTISTGIVTGNADVFIDNFTGGSAFNILGAATHTLSSIDFDNFENFVIVGNAAVNMTGSSTFTNEIAGIIDFQGNGNMNVTGAGPFTLINNGTVQKSVGAGTASLGMNTTNNGSVDVQTGTLIINGNYSQASGNINGAGNLTVNGLSTLSGGTLGAGGAFNTNGGIDITGAINVSRVINTVGGSINNGSINGPGTFNVTGGTFTTLGISDLGFGVTNMGGTININGTLDVGGINLVNNAGTVNVNGTLNSPGGAFTSSDTVLVASSGIINGDINIFNGSFTAQSGSAITGNIINDGILASNGSITGNVTNNSDLFGIGTVTGNVTNNGNFAPGSLLSTSTGTFVIDGDLTLTANSNFILDISGLSPETEYDLLAVSGNAELNGTLTTIVDTANYTAQLDDTFNPVTFLSRTGTFASVTNSQGFGYELTYKTNTIDVVTTTIPGLLLPADPISEAVTFSNGLEARLFGDVTDKEEGLGNEGKLKSCS